MSKAPHRENWKKCPHCAFAWNMNMADGIASFHHPSLRTTLRSATHASGSRTSTTPDPNICAWNGMRVGWRAVESVTRAGEGGLAGVAGMMAS